MSEEVILWYWKPSQKYQQKVMTEKIRGENGRTISYQIVSYLLHIAC